MSHNIICHRFATFLVRQGVIGFIGYQHLQTLITLKDHTPTKKKKLTSGIPSVLNTTCEYQSDLNVQSHSGMLQNAAEFIQKQLLGFSSDCSPSITQTLSCFHCLQASMWGNQHVGFRGGECHSNP